MRGKEMPVGLLLAAVVVLLVVAAGIGLGWFCGQESWLASPGGAYTGGANAPPWYTPENLRLGGTGADIPWASPAMGGVAPGDPLPYADQPFGPPEQPPAWRAVSGGMGGEEPPLRGCGYPARWGVGRAAEPPSPTPATPSLRLRSRRPGRRSAGGWGGGRCPPRGCGRPTRRGARKAARLLSPTLASLSFRPRSRRPGGRSVEGWGGTRCPPRGCGRRGGGPGRPPGGGAKTCLNAEDCSAAPYNGAGGQVGWGTQWPSTSKSSWQPSFFSASLRPESCPLEIPAARGATSTGRTPHRVAILWRCTRRS